MEEYRERLGSHEGKRGGRKGQRSREGGQVEGNRWQVEEVESWRHLGKCRIEEVERVEIVTEEGGRRRL